MIYFVMKNPEVKMLIDNLLFIIMMHVGKYSML